MPNAVAMISSTNPPGRVRNLSLGFFAASAPIGGYFGALFLGAFMETTEWKWFFVFMLVGPLDLKFGRSAMLITRIS